MQNSGSNDAMKQDLIDLILGDLDPARDAALREEVRNSPALQAQLAEFETLFGFMRRGEQIESDPSIRKTVMAAARKATAPSLSQRLAAIPALIRYRFQHSRGFRIAAVSLGIHLVAMAILFQMFVHGGKQAPPTEFQLSKLEPPHVEVRPDSGFVAQLRFARASRVVRLRKYGVDGQAESIREGIEALLDRQSADGSWENFESTCDAALALMAENVSSSDLSTHGQALHRAMRVIRNKVAGGARGARALEALIEDWALNHAELSAPDRAQSVDCIRTLLAAGDNDAAGIAWAHRAGFADFVRESVPENAATLMAEARENAEGYRAALSAARAGEASAILLLQQPYRA